MARNVHYDCSTICNWYVLNELPFCYFSVKLLYKSVTRSTETMLFSCLFAFTGLQIVIWIGAFKANDRKHPHPPDYNMDGQIAALKEALNQTPSNVWIWGGYFLNLFKVSERVDMSFSTYLVTKVGKSAATTWLSPWARVMKEISLAGKELQRSLVNGLLWTAIKTVVSF